VNQRTTQQQHLSVWRDDGVTLAPSATAPSTATTSGEPAGERSGRELSLVDDLLGPAEAGAGTATPADVDRPRERPAVPGQVAIRTGHLPPVGSAARTDGERARTGRLDRLEPGVRRGLRRLLVLVALLPLVALLARETPRFLADPVLLGYGMSVLAATILLFYLAYTRYDDPSDPRFSRVANDAGAPPLPAVPSVTLLVAVKDEREVIERCVRSMVESDYPDLQVIVVDDCSEDGTAERLAELERELGFTLLALERNVGKKNALVRGAELATGEVIAFTDSDCVLAPDALRRCVAALVAHPGLGAVSGHARALNADASLLTKVQDTWYEGSFRVTKAAESTFGSVTCVSGPLAVFRRDAIWNYLPAWAKDRFLGGEFRFATDRQLTGYVLGQRWLGRKLKDAHRGSAFVDDVDYPERRWRVGYVRSAMVWTVVPERVRAFVKQQVRWKKSFVRNLFFTGRFMWRRGLGPSFLYYGHALWVLAAPFMAVRHLVWAPVHAEWMLTALYLCGVLVKGSAWGLAYLVDHPGSPRWRYRPLMSLISSVALSWLLVYSLATIRRGIWSRTT
jgi:cellulose synthase/poly-beta-1,6-N-acetylglucosamine synthase-like glycosyltransferase